MRPLHDLIHTDEPAIDQIREWLLDAHVACELLPPSEARNEVLLKLQVTTRSPMGALAWESGGLLIDNGWLRVLGSGHPRLTRDLLGWNANRAQGFCLVADDAVGGFFAINGGAFGEDTGKLYYWAPDSLNWEALNITYSHFLVSMLHGNLAKFYANLRWQGWREDLSRLTGEQCYVFYPFLFTDEGDIETSERKAVPVQEAFDIKVSMVMQLNRLANPPPPTTTTNS